MRIISFNCEGIVSAAEKGFFTWAQDRDADVICLQDIRAQESELTAPSFNPDGYFRYFNEEHIRHAGQGGVAILYPHSSQSDLFLG